ARTTSQIVRWLDLKEATKGVDIIAPSITAIVLKQDLYRAARTVPEAGQNPVVERLKKLTAEYPDILKASEFRIAFSYFALLAGNFTLAEEYALASQTDRSDNLQSLQIRAYDLLLQAIASAGQKDFSKSLRLAREGVDQLHLFFHGFEHLSSNWAPAL